MERCRPFEVQFIHDLGKALLNRGVGLECLHLVDAALDVGFILIGGLVDQSRHDGLHLHTSAHLVHHGGEDQPEISLADSFRCCIKHLLYIVHFTLYLRTSRVFVIKLKFGPVVQKLILFFTRYGKFKLFFFVIAHAHEHSTFNGDLAFVAVIRVELWHFALNHSDSRKFGFLLELI